MILPYFCIFCDYFPFEEDLVLYLKNFEIPSSKADLYQVDQIGLLRSGEKHFQKILLRYYILFCYFVPLEKEVDLHLNDFESLYLGTICAR
jgi:hypothetical protein